jgi:protein TonB
VKSRTVVVSALLHVVVFGLALQVSKSKAARRATSVAVVGEKKKAEKKKEEEKPKPKPKPKPMVASAQPEVTHQAAPAPTKAAPEPVQQAAPVETGLTMDSDDGPGIALGGPAPNKAKGAAPTGGGEKQQRAPTVKKEKALSPKDNPEEDDCTEAPSKPVVLQKPNEVGYTQDARANGVEGILKLRIVVAADGSVSDVTVLKSVEAALDAAAIAAVKSWVFKPSMRCGRAMAGGVFTFQSTFELGD